MTEQQNNIHVISAPSILGLKPGGVALLGKALLDRGLLDALGLRREHDMTEVPDLNQFYDPVRDEQTRCLNPALIRQFSDSLLRVVDSTVRSGKFPVVLGGDCSILLGILPAFKNTGKYGLVFMDAHADFYQGDQSPTGEVADMDLAMVTGRGPEILTNINNCRPYVIEDHIIQIGQRDFEETREYGATDISKIGIHCIDHARIISKGVQPAAEEALRIMQEKNLAGWWLHFDTDVLADTVNPAVDYRLPGGLQLDEAEYLIKKLIQTKQISGMSVTIYNPLLDPGKVVASRLVRVLSQALKPEK